MAAPWAPQGLGKLGGASWQLSMVLGMFGPLLVGASHGVPLRWHTMLAKGLWGGLGCCMWPPTALGCHWKKWAPNVAHLGWAKLHPSAHNSPPHATPI